MKKLALISSLFSYFIVVANTYAADIAPIQVAPPAGQGINPETPIGTIISNIITIVFVVAILLVMFMLISGAITWITSAGDKEKVGSARGRIINALIGLAILALAFLILNVAGQLINFDISTITIKPLGPPP